MFLLGASVETRTFIGLTDIEGVEFACPKCTARVFYPIAKQYDRMANQCPNCHESWFIQGGIQNPSVNTTVDQVRDVMASLQNVAKSELVRVNIRLQVKTPESKK